MNKPIELDLLLATAPMDLRIYCQRMCPSGRAAWLPQRWALEITKYLRRNHFTLQSATGRRILKLCKEILDVSKSKNVFLNQYYHAAFGETDRETSRVIDHYEKRIDVRMQHLDLSEESIQGIFEANGV